MFAVIFGKLVCIYIYVFIGTPIGAHVCAPICTNTHKHHAPNQTLEPRKVVWFLTLQRMSSTSQHESWSVNKDFAWSSLKIRTCNCRATCGRAVHLENLVCAITLCSHLSAVKYLVIMSEIHYNSDVFSSKLWHALVWSGGVQVRKWQRFWQDYFEVE